MDRKKRVTPLDLMPDVANVVSNTECTGLTPTLPSGMEEWAEELSLSSTALPPQPPKKPKEKRT